MRSTPDLTTEQKKSARAIFEGKTEGRRACSHCAGLHDTVAGIVSTRQPCPRIRKVEYHPGGEVIASVEYWPPGDWEQDVVFPRDVYDDEESD